jgi:hypothetical protein
MIVLRDFALFIVPGLVAAGGWLYAFSLRKQGGAALDREVNRVPARLAP